MESGWGSKWKKSGKRPNSDILIDNFQKMGYKLQELLGELNRLRIPETHNREDPLNLLGNASAGKQIG